jgi:hypothetical protein
MQELNFDVLACPEKKSVSEEGDINVPYDCG